MFHIKWQTCYKHNTPVWSIPISYTQKDSIPKSNIKLEDILFNVEDIIEAIRSLPPTIWSCSWRRWYSCRNIEKLLIFNCGTSINTMTQITG